MNIFENYLSKINDIILDNKDDLNLNHTDNLKSVNLEVPPDHFNFDLSTNICLVLSKVNKIDPNNLAKDIKKLLLENINHFEVIEIAGPGFLNIKLSKEGLASNINEIFQNKETFGSKLKVIVPGIRNQTDNNNDQKRTLSAKKAIEFGADIIVVGRPITSADSPGKAAEIFHQSIK